MQAQKEESNQNSQEISIIGWSEITPKSTNWSLCAPKRSFLCGSGQVCSTITLSSHSPHSTHTISLSPTSPLSLTLPLTPLLLLFHSPSYCLTLRTHPPIHTPKLSLYRSHPTLASSFTHSFTHSLTLTGSGKFIILLVVHLLTTSCSSRTPSHPYSFCTDLVTMSLTLTEHSILSGSQYYLIIATDEDSMKKKRK